MASALTLKLQDTYPSKDTSTRDPLNAVTHELTTLSSGRLTIDLLPAGAVVPAFGAPESVHRGVLDAAWSTPT